MRTSLETGRRTMGGIIWNRRGNIVLVGTLWLTVLGGFTSRSFAQCGDGIVQGGETCDPPCERGGCPNAGETCSADCGSCIANDNDDDVRKYACRCYERMKITPAELKAAIGADTIDCKARCSNEATISCTTDKRCRFCSNDNTRVCTANTDCQGGGTCPAPAANQTCPTAVCSNDTAIDCTKRICSNDQAINCSSYIKCRFCDNDHNITCKADPACRFCSNDHTIVCTDNAPCRFCSNDAALGCTSDARCRFCSDAAKTPCDDATPCPAGAGTCPPQGGTCGTCLPGGTCGDQGVCTNNIPCRFCDNNHNVPCTNNTNCRLCSKKKCSGLPANTVCTGTGQGTCPAGQTCNFIECTDDTPCTPVGGGTCGAQGTCGEQGTCRILKPLHTTVDGEIQAVDCKGIDNCVDPGAFPAECDRPAWLELSSGPTRCYGNSYIRKWEIEKPRGGGAAGNYKVTVSLLCRHKNAWKNGDNDFSDIAIIMHNSDNGQTCWFQTDDPKPGDLNGKSVPLPHTAPPTPPYWLDPSVAAKVNCIHCHDNGPWMNSRWMFRSEIALTDGRGPYLNEGNSFKEWQVPKFITVDKAKLKNTADGHNYEDKNCTGCHKIHSAESTKTKITNLTDGAGGKSWKEWIKFTVGSSIEDRKFPEYSREHKCNGGAQAGIACMPSNDCPGGACNAGSTCTGGDRNGLACDCPNGTCPPHSGIDYWMPTGENCRHCQGLGTADDVYANNAEHWKKTYGPHVSLLMACAAAKGDPAKDKTGAFAKGEPCKVDKPDATGPAVATVTSCGTSGVNLCADTNGDSKWEVTVPASTAPYEEDYVADPPITITPGTTLQIGWSADADHPNCFIATTFPAGVEVNGITTGSNWVLSEGSATIGVVTEPGDYHFHIDCDDDVYDQITAPMTFRISGQPATVLQIKGIKNGEATMAFNYPTCAGADCKHAEVTVEPTDEVYISWVAFNVVTDSCVLRETLAPFGSYTPGPCPNPSGSTISTDEGGFEAFPLEPVMDQNYRLECLGDDGPWHCADLTLRINGAPPTIAWDPSLTSNRRTTRSLIFGVDPPVVATGTSGQSAIRVTMVDLQHPVPANVAANDTRNFTSFDVLENGVCAGGTHDGHHCDTNADCRVCAGGLNMNRLCDDNGDCPGSTCPPGGVCSGLTECTHPDEQNGCARWVGKPETVLESQDVPGLGSYRAARLQCTPFYWDWAEETAAAPITVVGGEIVPSSRYEVRTFAPICKGMEDTCTTISPPVQMLTRRSGDVVSTFNPPSTTTQPDATDVTQLVNKFKNLFGAPSKAIALIQPNLPELKGDLGALDIVQCVDALKSFAYPFGGPCPCPSLAACGALACPGGAGVCVASALSGLGSAATCIKTCRGGTNNGDPCLNHTHCPGGGVCDKECLGGANVGKGCSSISDCPGSTCVLVTNNAFCRDKCGRCTP